MLVCAFLCASCTRDRGCNAHPAFPAPSLLSRGNVYANLGRIAPRERGFTFGAIFVVAHPSRRCARARLLIGMTFETLMVRSAVRRTSRTTRPPGWGSARLQRSAIANSPLTNLDWTPPPRPGRAFVPTKRASSAMGGQDVAFCSATKFATQPLLTGNGNPAGFSVMVRLAYKLRSRVVRAPHELRGRKHA
jgi:hypothetical protein